MRSGAPWMGDHPSWTFVNYCGRKVTIRVCFKSGMNDCSLDNIGAGESSRFVDLNKTFNRPEYMTCYFDEWQNNNCSF
jgi:hypothetical protein